MKRYSYPSVGEVRFRGTLPNGLSFSVVPKPGFVKKSVSILVHFGSIHCHFEQANHQSVTLHQGIHHFLEHLLFENPDLDITRKFSEANASVNAYTASNRTAYYFSTTDDIEKPLTHLLEMVFRPTFDSKAIEKERKIILQEHQMYQDDIDQSMYYHCMEMLFPEHPIHLETLGSVESLQAISAKDLIQAYEIGYHPTNMELLFVGDFQPQEVEVLLLGYDILTRKHKKSPYRLVNQPIFEPNAPIEKRITVDTAIPFLDFAWKIPQSWITSPLLCGYHEIMLSFLLEMFFGKQSDIHHQWLRNKYINDNFEYYALVEEDYGYLRFHIETNYPQELIKQMNQVIHSMDLTSVSNVLFQANRNRLLGSYYRLFNRVDSLANFMGDLLIKGYDVEDLMNKALSIQPQDFLPYMEWIKTAPSVIIEFGKKDNK